jgi:hypothetical protein
MSVSLQLPECWKGAQPEEVDLTVVPCLGVDEVSPTEVRAGSRTLIVTPYFPAGSTGSGKICSGQYGQWQVLTGLGGQIHRGLYVGDSFKIEESTIDPPGISSEVDTNDCCSAGERCLAIRDRGRWYVTKMSGGSSSATATAVAVGLVLGGNVLPCVIRDDIKYVKPQARSTYPTGDAAEDEFGFKDSDYPVYRPYAYTLPTVDPSGAEQSQPIVNDWRRYDLDKNFKLGGKLPRLPDGLCYVRVERPYTIGSSAWDSNVDRAPARPTVGDQAPVKGVILGSGNLKVWFKHAAAEGLPENGGSWKLSDAIEDINVPMDLTKVQELNSYFTLSSGGAQLTLEGDPVGVYKLSFDAEGYLTAELIRITEMGTQPLNAEDAEGLGAFDLSIKAGVLASYNGSEELAASVAGDVLSSPLQDRAVIITCLNDSGRQGFYAGDIVLVDKTAIRFPDRYGEAAGNTAADTQYRTVYRIIGGSGTNARANITSY